jgi:hypothetical protein
MGSVINRKSGLKRYWVEFDYRVMNFPSPHYGIMAYSCEDALLILKEVVFKYAVMPEPIRLTENVDISTLDAGHVLPNMAVPYWRGIWFPQGLASSVSDDI